MSSLYVPLYKDYIMLNYIIVSRQDTSSSRVTHDKLTKFNLLGMNQGSKVIHCRISN